jgi:enamine deaminase RidA (YjgF/YER057c/UK114 family)
MRIDSCVWGFVLAAAAGCTAASGQPATGKVEDRIKELKIDIPKYTPSKAPIAGCVIVGNLAFVSGHTPVDADGKTVTGQVGTDLDVVAGKKAARLCGIRVLSALKHELGDLNRVRRVVKVLGMVNAPAGFKDQPAVINGFSELFIDILGKERGTGTRSAVGMSSLPGNAAVEVEAIFEIDSR